MRWLAVALTLAVALMSAYLGRIALPLREDAPIELVRVGLTLVCFSGFLIGLVVNRHRR